MKDVLLLIHIFDVVPVVMTREESKLSNLLDVLLNLRKKTKKIFFFIFTSLFNDNTTQVLFGDMVLVRYNLAEFVFLTPF